VSFRRLPSYRLNISAKLLFTIRCPAEPECDESPEVSGTVGVDAVEIAEVVAVVSGESIEGAVMGKTAGGDILDIVDVVIMVGGGESRGMVVEGTCVCWVVFSECGLDEASSPPTVRSIIDLAVLFCIHSGFLVHLRDPSTSEWKEDLLELDLPRNGSGFE